jgi:hypothetical protein
MKVESNLSFYKRFIGLIVVSELILFLLAYLISRNNPTLDNFFMKLLIVALISLFFSGVTPGNKQRHQTLGYNFTPVKLDGSREIPVAIWIASLIAIVLSMAIPVAIWFLRSSS